MIRIDFDVFSNPLHSFDSFYCDFHVSEDSISLNWVNVGVYSHELNVQYGKELLFIDKATFFISGISLALKNSNLIYNTKHLKLGEYKVFQIDGTDLTNNELDSLEFFCKSVTIQLPDDYRIREFSWLDDNTFLEKSRAFLSVNQNR